jgi:hypothetical protein
VELKSGKHKIVESTSFFYIDEVKRPSGIIREHPTVWTTAEFQAPDIIQIERYKSVAVLFSSDRTELVKGKGGCVGVELDSFIEKRYKVERLERLAGEEQPRVPSSLRPTDAVFRVLVPDLKKHGFKSDVESTGRIYSGALVRAKNATNWKHRQKIELPCYDVYIVSNKT